MPLPPGLSQKDADQVLRAVMDDDTNRLRVDAVISPSGHDLEIHYQDDSIAIGDPASDNILAIQSDGSIKVDIQDTSLEVTQGTTPWIVSGSVTTSPDVNIHDSSGNPLSSTGTSLNVDVTNTVPVSQSGAWTVTANAGTNLNTSLLALDSTLTNKSQFTKITDGTDTALVTGAGELNVLSTAQPGVDIGDVTVNNAAGASAVNIQDGGNSITVDGTVTANQGTSPWVVSGTITTSPDVNIHDSSGNALNATAGSLNSNVTNGAGASAVNIQDGGNSLTVDGTVTAVQSTGSNLHVEVDSGTIIANQGGTWTVQPGNTPNVFPWLTTIHQGGNAATVTVANALKVDASWYTTQVAGGVKILDQFGVPFNSNGTGSLTVEVQNSSIPVAQSGTWNINNVSGTVSLPTGASTSALQTTGNTSLASIDGKLNSLGQKTMANSVPVVIASDQSAVPVSGSVTVSGTTSSSNFPATVDTNYGTVGASTIRTAAEIGNATGAAAFNAGTTTAQTIRVVLPTDQTAIPATQSGTWNINNVSGTVSLPTGASTSALQTTGNTSLSSIDGKLNSLGQKTMANSVPVVIASDQSAVTISPSNGSLTDRSGSATTSSSQLAAANTSRKYLYIQNSSGGTLWFNFGVVAVTAPPSIRLQNGESFAMEGTFISTQAINIISAGGTRAYTAKEG